MLTKKILDAHQERVTRNKALFSAYNGELTPSLTISAGGIDDNVYINNLELIIDTCIDFGIGYTEPTLEGVDNPHLLVPQTKSLGVLIRDLWTNSAVTGTGYLKVVYIEHRKQYRLINVNPDYVIPIENPSDIDSALAYYVFSETTDEEGNKAALCEEYLLNDVGQWALTIYKNSFSQDTLIEYIASIGGIEDWEVETPSQTLPFQLLYHFKNLPNPNRFEGKSDLTNSIMQISDTINRVSSNEMRTLRLFAHPTPLFTGHDPEEIDERINKGIGRYMAFTSDVDVKQIDLKGDGLRASQTFRERLDKKQYELARIPQIALGNLDGVGALSGLSLQIIYQPLINKTNTKRSLLGACLSEIFWHIFENEEISIQWGESLPKNGVEATSEALNLVQLGVPVETVLERLNYPQMESRGILEYERQSERVRGDSTRTEP